MAELNRKYFVTGLKTGITEAPWNPVFTEEESKRMMFLDKTVVPGAFYVECAWYWPGDWPEKKSSNDLVKPHTHDYDEVIAFFGTDRDNPYDLCGQVELWIDGDQYLPEHSFLAFIPAGTEHGPLNIKRVDRPIFHFVTGPGKEYF